jgi:rhodanese-related sulfurtransferase
MPEKKVFRENFWIPLLILTGLVLICARIECELLPVSVQEDLPRGLSWITVSEARASDILWVDARPAEAYKRSHIPGAINVTLRDYDNSFRRFADLWRPNRRVVVYCDGGDCRLSAEVAGKLKRSVPESRIEILKGGYPAWLER